MKNKEGYYMVIPANVWDSDLSAKAILCYGHITVLANKGGFCYANNKYFEKVLDVSTTTVGRYLNELEKMGLIKRSMIYREGTKEIEQRRIYLNTGIFTDEHRPIIKDEQTPIFTDEQDNTTSNNNTSNNIIDVPSEDDIKGKMFFKLVDMYPKNRIGNRQHGLKKFKQLDIDKAKLALVNLNRYLAVAEGYVKSLQNYITEDCYTEDWLAGEEKLKKNKNNPVKGINTKDFDTNY